MKNFNLKNINVLNGKTLTLFAFLFLLNSKLLALDPFSITLTKVDATCDDNGQIIVNVSGATIGSDFIYQVINSDNSLYRTVNGSTGITVTSFADTITAVAPNSYGVLATQTNGGDSNSDSAGVVVVNIKKNLVYSYSSEQVCSGYNLRFNVTAGYPETYEVYERSGSTLGNLLISQDSAHVVLPLSAGEYRLKVIDECGNVTTHDITLEELGDIVYTVSRYGPTNENFYFMKNCDSILHVEKLSYRYTTTGNSYGAPAYRYPIQFHVVVDNPITPSTPTIIDKTYYSNEDNSSEFIFPCYYGETYNYTLTITDACGYDTTYVNSITPQVTGNINVVVADDCGLLPYFKANGYDFAYFSSPLYYEIISAPATYSGATKDTIYDDDNNGVLNNFTIGSETSPLVFGDYEIKFYDGCGRSITLNKKIEYRDLQTGIYGAVNEGCGDQYGSVSLRTWSGTYSKGINIDEVSILSGSNDFLTERGIASYPYVCPQNHINSAYFQMADIPVGDYLLQFVTVCGDTITTYRSIYGTQINFDYDVILNCGSYNFDFTFSSYLTLPKLYLQQYFPSVEKWGYPGDVSKVSDEFNSYNALNLANGTSNNNILQQLAGTEYNIAEEGKFRLLATGIASLDSAGEETCVYVLDSFNIDFSGVTINDYYVTTCVDGTTELLLDVLGAKPLDFMITKYNGTDTVIDNDTIPIFSKLPAGDYEVSIEDKCGNVKTFVFDTRSLKIPGIHADNIVNGENGKLYVAGMDYMDIYWTKGNDATVLSTENTLDFSPFTAATDTGTYYAHVNYPGIDTFCVDDILDYAIKVKSPGGVIQGMGLWLRADEGAPTTGNVIIWEDQSGNEHNAVKTTGEAPVIGDSLLNFNPTIDFNGSTTWLKLPDSIVDTANWRFFTVVRGGTGGNAISLGRGNQAHPRLTQRFGDDFYLYSSEGYSIYSLNYYSDYKSAGSPPLITTTSSPDGTTAFYAGINGGVMNTQDNGFGPSDSSFCLGTTQSYSGSNYVYDGEIAEVIWYNTTTWTNESPEEQKIESYLAIKYGITLAQSSAYSYLSSAGDTIWNANDAIVGSANYNNDIFGIGQDAVELLDQRVSKSINSDAIVTISSGYADFSSTNLDQSSRVQLSDFCFEMIANNGGDTLWSHDAKLDSFYVLERRWQVQEFGTVGDVYLQFDVDNPAFDVSPLLSDSSYYIVMDENMNGEFFDDTPIALTNISGSLWQTNAIDFKNGQLFTLATRQNDAFITTWDVSAGDAFCLPIEVLRGSVLVDWGDGQISTFVVGDNYPSHTVAVGCDTPSVKVFPSTAGDFGNASSMFIVRFDTINYSPEANDTLLLSIDQWGGNQWVSFMGAFDSCAKVLMKASDEPIAFNDSISCERMFRNCSNLTGMNGNWDWSIFTDSIINMAYMFYGDSVFNRPLNSWNVRNVTNMYYMFGHAYSFNQDLTTWDVGSVKTMYAMFAYAKLFNGDITNWDVSSVEDFSYMFLDAEKFNQNIKDWDVSSAKLMEGMFWFDYAFDQPIGEWGAKTSHVTSMAHMFQHAESFNQDISAWNTSAVTDMTSMFANAYLFNQPLASSTWDVSNVTSMLWMFRDAYAFNQPIGSWNVSAVSDMGYMLCDATSFDQNISSWDLSSLTDATNMLDRCGMSKSNYDALLNGWAAATTTAKGILTDSIPFGAATLEYCSGESGRTSLINNNFWLIDDDDIMVCQPYAPGGVFADLQLWLRADMGFGTLNPDEWTDFFNGDSCTIYNAKQVQGKAGVNNYNPGVYFDGVDDSIDVYDLYISLDSGVTSFISYSLSDYTSDNMNCLLKIGTDNAEEEFGLYANYASTDSYLSSGFYRWNKTVEASNNPSYFGDYFVSGTLSQDWFIKSALNELKYDVSVSTINTSYVTKRYNNYVGSYYNWGIKFFTFDKFRGRIPEVILYNRDLSVNERQRVDTYLALKYGVTINDTVNYLSSSSSVIYDMENLYQDYSNNVIGIGTDSVSMLLQKIATSTDDTTLIIAYNPEFSLSNLDPSRSVLADTTFVVVGNDGKDSLFTRGFFGKRNRLMTRTWVADVTGEPDSVFVAIPNTVVFPRGIPVVITSLDETIDSHDKTIELSDDGTYYWTKISIKDISNNQDFYFTFGALDNYKYLRHGTYFDEKGKKREMTF